MTDLTSSPFLLGPWRVEPLRHSLERENGEGARHLTPKAMEVLVFLASRASAVVTRGELLDSVWPDTHIREEVLTRAISDLRAALGDDRRRPRFIETIPKVGYRLMVEVDPLNEAPTNAAAVHETPGPGPWSPPRRLLSFGLALTALLALAASLSRALRDPTPPSSTLSSSVLPSLARPSSAPLAAVPLTTFPGFESYAEISPDGTRVAFARSKVASTAPDIFTIPSAGGEPRRLTSDPAADVGPTWSPDGRRLAFMRHRDEGCVVLEIAADGGPERPLGSCGGNVTGDLAWSPSGEWLAFSDRERDGEPMGIFLLSTLTGVRHKVVSPDGEHWGDHTPSFSPDGRHLAFVRSVSLETQDVYRIDLTDLEGSEPVALTQDNASIRGHAWLPDGTGLVVSSRRTGARGLWRVALDGSPPQWIPLAVGHAWFPTLARHTGHLLFEHRILESALRQRSLGHGADGGTWLPSTHEDLMPSHSPDGTRVAFASNRSGHFEIWTADADGENPEQVTALAGAFNGSPRWTPDSTALVFDARLNGQADIYRIALGTIPRATPERLTQDTANDLAPSLSPDGRFLYFGSNRSGRWQIWRQLATGGDATRITEDGGYMALPAADGDTLYLTRYGQPGLFHHSLAAGITQPVPGTEALYSSEHWTVVGDTVYFLAAVTEGGVSTVRLQRLESGSGSHPQPLADLGHLRLMPGLSVTRDETRILFTELTRLEADIWRVDGDTGWRAR